MENNKEINTLRNSAYLYDYDNRDILLADIPFYLSYGDYAKDGVLELGCGTGRVSLVLAENGFSVTGLDLSENMLAAFYDKLREKPDIVSERINIIQGDMTDFSLEKKFGLIISPFRAFQALTDDKDIEKSLACIKNHLVENGIFIINTFRPYDNIGEDWVYPERVQWERTDEKTGMHIVKKHWGDKIHIKNQIIYPHFTFEVTYPDGRVERVTDDFKLKYYRYEQLKSLLEFNGFDIIEEYGWYDKSSIVGGRKLIFICKKAE
ncbi:MAG: class I SAM-dependent methyltransferase [Firmicutes bacterium HGW-Firmicutes-21]|nr:MAG: class I SAM-dependent methyltransferase [Firmicutes bacterium HGW-Firmicutes-21]